MGSVEKENERFWDELCGSGLARVLGVVDHSEASLRRFDAGFLAVYPYLMAYVEREELAGRRVLEVGLGYGTLGQILATRAGFYLGLDVARNPLKLMQSRLESLGATTLKVVQGSVLALPVADESLDYVYTIGCLHHCGDLAGSVREIHRVLRAGGRAVAMVYNRHSLDRLVRVPLARLRASWRRADREAVVRGLYDSNASGDAAPHTDFTSRRAVRRIFGMFRSVRVETRNFVNYGVRGRLVLRREWFLGTVDRIGGVDLYVTATK